MADVELYVIPKKFYRHFFKALSYYTCQMNRACTMSELQAYVFLKSGNALSEDELKLLADKIVPKLVSSGIATTSHGGFYRLCELLRSVSDDEVSKPAKSSNNRPLKRTKKLHFSNAVTVWKFKQEESGAMPTEDKTNSLEARSAGQKSQHVNVSSSDDDDDDLDDVSEDEEGRN